MQRETSGNTPRYDTRTPSVLKHFETAVCLEPRHCSQSLEGCPARPAQLCSALLLIFMLGLMWHMSAVAPGACLVSTRMPPRYSVHIQSPPTLLEDSIPAARWLPEEDRRISDHTISKHFDPAIFHDFDCLLHLISESSPAVFAVKVLGQIIDCTQDKLGTRISSTDNVPSPFLPIPTLDLEANRQTARCSVVGTNLLCLCESSPHSEQLYMPCLMQPA